MGKVFVIPDVHLKAWMFEKASDLVKTESYDAIVMLGDLVDDWYQEKNLDLYNETFDATVNFASKHPETFWCYGNHDISYIWEAMESGYSYYAEDTVVKGIESLKAALTPENSMFMLRIDNVLFSHAGLTESFVKRHFGCETIDIDTMIARINCMGKAELWENDSPIWARPQDGSERPYNTDLMQVVGHTPVRFPDEMGNFLTLDTFSTSPYGPPIGDQRFVWVDTVDKTWRYAD